MSIQGPDTPDLQPLRQMLAAWEDLEPRKLIAVLQKTQGLYGYLPVAALDFIAEHMRIPEARVYGVTTFYSQFRLTPQGDHVIQVCDGTACNVKGSGHFVDELVSLLGIRPGETTPDGKITFQTVACVGACGVAPAVVIDGEVHGRMTSASLRKTVNALLDAPPSSGSRKVALPVVGSPPGKARTFLDRCCSKCKTSPDNPCPDFLRCRLEGDSCHDDPACEAYREELRKLVRHTSEAFEAHVFLCKGLTCDASGEAGIRKAFERELARHGILDKVEFIETGCMGLCEVGPIVQVSPHEAFYCRVRAEDVPEIVERHILKHEIVERLLYDRDCRTEADIPFYKAQVRRVLSNTGKIDPENIDEYIARGGYRALYDAIRRGSPEKIVETILASGLRGRGGGGFPTGRKWAIARSQPDPERYLVCNADEGDPGAFMDRSVLEGDPHRVIEGILLGAYAIGARKAFIYCRAEYPLAIRRLEVACAQARAYGLLGKNLLGAGFDIDLEVVQGAGAFVCGEETALIASIEGKRGMAQNKPPFPAEHGFRGHPTCVNNVETFANVPLIIANGADWFRSVGTNSSPGTKIFSLSGKVRLTGLVEVPMGTTMRQVLEEIGGGAPEGSAIKAAQTGGPSGGCIPEHLMNVAIDYDSLKALGGMMGSGGLVVTDRDTCMVAFARFFLSFTQHESCGKCIPCREGTKRMLEILDRIVAGEGKMSDLDELRNLAAVIRRTSACGLGQSAPNPVLSTLQYFEHEYLAHIRDLRCTAGVCKSLLRYHILDFCRGCTACARKCPVQCISGERGQVFVIDQPRCTKCGECYRVCPFNAVAKV